MNIKKMIWMGLLLIFLVLLSACFPIDRYRFPEGTFEYQGDPHHFYNDLFFEEFTMTLSKITEEAYLNSDHMNVLKNLQNKEVFSVTCSFKFTIEDEANIYPFEFLGKYLTQPDSYKIVVTFDNEEIGITGTLTMRLAFGNAIGGSTDKGSLAGSIYVSIVESEINGNKNKETFSFPSVLKFVDQEESK